MKRKKKKKGEKEGRETLNLLGLAGEDDARIWANTVLLGRGGLHLEGQWVISSVRQFEGFLHDLGKRPWRKKEGGRR